MNVAIVNDSRLACKILADIVTSMPGFKLAWTAFDGHSALLQRAAKPTDIILMDLVMPGIDGAETTRRIMATNPCVILLVTSTIAGNRDKVFEAMGCGALDAVTTPSIGMRGDLSGGEVLQTKLRTVARLVRSPRPAPYLPTQVRQPSEPGKLSTIIAIGASTGGPQALAEVLRALPEDFPGCVLITQHVDQHFATGLVAWLQHNCRLPIRLAEPGQRIAPGTVWVAGRNDHLVLGENGALRYTPEPEDTPYRPSVDALFESVARVANTRRVGVLLTGMGQDGAQGLLAMRKSGAWTIAQDAETSVVYGMPRAAAALGAASEILPLYRIGARMVAESDATTASANETGSVIAPTDDAPR